MPKPKSKANYFSIQAKVNNATDGELLIYGDISSSKWYDEDVTPKEIDAELKKLGDVKNLSVRINSYGGEVFAGQAIISMLTAKKQKGCKVTSIIEGIAASMASAISMVGDEIIMYDGAMMMIHKPSSFVWGNSEDLQKEIEVLNKCENTLLVNYMNHYSGTEDELKSLLSAETWLTAQEALDCGLCTKIEGEVKIAASAKGFMFNGTEIPTEILEKQKDKIKVNDKGGEKEMFNKEQQEKIQSIIDSGKPIMFTKSENGEFEISELELATDFLTADAVTAKAGKEMTADEVLAMFDTVSEQAAKIANFDTEKAVLTNKATAYDTIKNKAIEQALSNGVKAKADKFDNERWTKVFDSFSIEEIQAQAEEWKVEAGIVLNAGRHISQQTKQTTETQFNEEDYLL